MAPASKLAATRAKAAQNAVKEKVFHPQSRKANQLERASLRKTKLGAASSRRSQKQIEKGERYAYFLNVLDPTVDALTLPQVHQLITEQWLTRHDPLIKTEEASRRKGRPPSTYEAQLREQKLQDIAEYRSGLEIPDLTHPPTVELYRRWENSDPAYLHLLRFIRVCGTDTSLAPVIKLGHQEVDLGKFDEAKAKRQKADTGESMELDEDAPSIS